MMSLLGGLALGIFHYLAVLYTVDSALLEHAPSQWPIIIVGAVGGFYGSILDSVIGATLQYSG